MVATWVAAIAAVVAGYFAYHAYQAQERQVELLQGQLVKDRERDRLENQLKRFQYGPYFRVFPVKLDQIQHLLREGVVSVDAFRMGELLIDKLAMALRCENGGVCALLIHDVRNCALDDLKVFWPESFNLPPCELVRYECLDDFCDTKVWALIYSVEAEDYQRTVKLTVEVEFATEDGYADRHIYETFAGVKHWKRKEPAYVRLDSTRS